MGHLESLIDNDYYTAAVNSTVILPLDGAIHHQNNSAEISTYILLIIGNYTRVS